MNYFAQDYFEARSRFLASASRAGAKLHRLPIRARGPAGDELSVDIATLGDLSSGRVLLHTSGIHGVEGFAGSALQIAALERGGFKVPAVFVHILNPYGMAWLRRVNENNVDLNRNFAQEYRALDDSYARIDASLNNELPTPVYFSRLAAQILVRGYRPLKNAIMQGQYEFPKGLSYGGQKLEESTRLYKNWLKQNVKNAKTVFAIDVHTGLGPFAEEVLFCYTNESNFKFGRKVTQPKAPIGYNVAGGLHALTAELFADTKHVHFTQEFGTEGNLKLLNCLRLENQAFQREAKTSAANLRLMRAMNPESEVWQQKVIDQGLATLNSSMKWLAESD